ncbi:MAG: hypothetical protein IPG04_24365 [Polyangiaceae bacterium]|nr:hypothetical protein [Polyangiaceae bacterium]
MSKNLSLRLEELAQGVLGPLVLGGPMRLVPPLGPQLAMTIGEGRRISDDDLRARIDVARVRRARFVAPLDALPDISPAEWALVAALNDLLQATNHELSGPFTRGRHATLLDAIKRLLSALDGPRSTLEVIVRHATFARLLEVERVDTLVRAWAGSAQYRGQDPDRTMTFWPKLRRVQLEPRHVPLSAMADGLELVPLERFHDLVGQLLARSPLTDLATVTRSAPAFAWTQATLELVAYPTGRTLASRALGRSPDQQVLAALERATRALGPGEASSIATSFHREVFERATSARV